MNMNPEFKIMVLMGIRDGKKIVDIAKDIDRCQQIVSRYLTGLREEGLITQELGAKGKNAKRNSRKLTDEGRKVLSGHGIDATRGSDRDGQGDSGTVQTKVSKPKARKPRKSGSTDVFAGRDMAEVAREAAVPFSVTKCLPGATSSHAGEHEGSEESGERGTITKRDEQHIGGAK